MVKISNIQTNEIEDILILAEAIFKKHDSNVRGTLDYKVDWEISIKLTLDDEIIGFYLFDIKNISNNGKYKGKKGIEGVALGVNESQRGCGYGDILVNESYKIFKDTYNYIWGMHMHSLNIKPFWQKRRDIISDNRSYFTSVKMFENKVKIPQINQPDAISCGNTCIKMTLDYLNSYTNTSINDIIKICGTNAKHGTRDIEMRKGLEYFNIPHQQNGTKGDDDIQIEYLNRVLNSGNIFFLRTLTYGMKHWVIVCGKENGLYHINDPGQGSRTFITDRLLEVWKPRDYDGFEIFL